MSFDNRAEYLNSIHHDGSSRYVRAPANLSRGDTVILRLRAAAAAPIRRVLLRTCPDGEEKLSEMQEASAEAACRWWQAELPIHMPVEHYRFLLFTADGAWWFNGTGLHRHTPTDSDDFRLLAGYQAPTWVWDSVFYQIFPDRFADGDPASNVRTGEFSYRDYQSTARSWGEPPAANGRAAGLEFFGGDLPGISAHLAHLEELGANALFLNPVFSAYTNHRYDVTDYFNVDPHVGGNLALQALRQATSARGMRYILDIVPNHCGMLHPWFQAAQTDPQALSADYFTFRRRPDDYECWLGVRSLPKLNYRSAALREVMYAGGQSVFRHWLRPPYAADGWRIDVANMLARQGLDQLGAEVGRGIRQAVKEENPDAYLLGENFFDATHQLQGDCWDAVMNYTGFGLPLWRWMTDFQIEVNGQRSVDEQPWSTAALVETWAAFRAPIPWAIARQQFNLLDSHDTPRLLSVLGGNRAYARLAISLQMTYPGVPCVYYGDEIGLGSNGEHPRACMPWERSQWDEDLLAFYQKLIHLRRHSPALVQGGFQVILAEKDTFAYVRDSDEESVIVVAQRGPADRPAGPLPVAYAAIADGTEFEELFSGQRLRVENGNLPLPLLPVGGQVWQEVKG